MEFVRPAGIGNQKEQIHGVQPGPCFHVNAKLLVHSSFILPRGLLAGKSVKLGFGLGLRSMVNADRHICLKQNNNETCSHDGDSKHTV